MGGPERPVLALTEQPSTSASLDTPLRGYSTTLHSALTEQPSTSASLDTPLRSYSTTLRFMLVE
ncbi:hypothetical protein [Rathayibacter sp. VKM Ac-2927]|uniref:hypothetical protein n=1 Tax=Rathayibacter sp. VKM Ac-2927 TaxID=2929478 RepID=UPI001FB1B332|nr:hypothetical protein [Rathayibacter sp. VKM Ac-2927]MCJ1686620.1 hypothetical protein [Rathayibacter sp. VKM Ac-2927]